MALRKWHSDTTRSLLTKFAFVVCVLHGSMMYSYVTDSTTVLAIVFLLFLIPSVPCCCSWQS